MPEEWRLRAEGRLGRRAEEVEHVGAGTLVTCLQDGLCNVPGYELVGGDEKVTFVTGLPRVWLHMLTF